MGRLHQVKIPPLGLDQRVLSPHKPENLHKVFLEVEKMSLDSSFGHLVGYVVQPIVIPLEAMVVLVELF